MGKQKQDESLEALDAFYDNGLILDDPLLVKSGKEATVYRCPADPATGREFLAAKVYRSRDTRRFASDSMYQEGRVILERRTRLAFEKKTAVGREFQAASWTENEYQTLRTLHAAGADVPQTFARTPGAILMEYIGDAEGPAPMLSNVHLERDEATQLFERVLWNIELWLARDRIHADLSPFNILAWNGRVTIIDFPQAVDPRFNPHARDLLGRDIANVCRYFARFGAHGSPEWLASDLWRRFQRSEL